jgi:hypothetical protein
MKLNINDTALEINFSVFVSIMKREKGVSKNQFYSATQVVHKPYKLLLSNKSTNYPFYILSLTLKHSLNYPLPSLFPYRNNRIPAIHTLIALSLSPTISLNNHHDPSFSSKLSERREGVK